MRLELTTVAGIALLALASTLPLAAQGRGGGGRGTDSLGRRGYQWQTDIDLAKEQQRKFEAELAALSTEEWKGTALAWLELAVLPKSRTIHVEDSFHVGRIAAKKTEAEHEEDESSWTLTYAKKPPRTLAVTMNDRDETRIDCSTAAALKAEEGLLGIFQHEGSLLCSFRPAAER